MMNVFQFQDKYKTTAQQKEAMRGMKKEEVAYIIASCGTPQGKTKYTNMYKSINR